MSGKELFSRNELYWGEEFQTFLQKKFIAVIGLGGVGGAALEALARLGISNFLIADFDVVSISNINRQIIALHSTVGMKKTEAFRARLYEINPDISLKVYDGFLDEDSWGSLFEKKPDFIVDAIDTMRPKISLIKFAKENEIPLISSFGAGNRMDGSKLYVTDIKDIVYKDNFTKNILSKLKKYADIESGIWAVCSTEHARNLKKVKNFEKIVKNDGRIEEYVKFTPASNSIVPSISGYLAANKILSIFYENYFSKAR